MHESIILYVPAPPVLPTLLHNYRTTIAQYTTPPPEPPLYAIHHTIWVMVILCALPSRLPYGVA